MTSSQQRQLSKLIGSHKSAHAKFATRVNNYIRLSIALREYLQVVAGPSKQSIPGFRRTPIGIWMHSFAFSPLTFSGFNPTKAVSGERILAARDKSMILRLSSSSSPSEQAYWSRSSLSCSFAAYRWRTAESLACSGGGTADFKVTGWPLTLKDSVTSPLSGWWSPSEIN